MQLIAAHSILFSFSLSVDGDGRKQQYIVVYNNKWMNAYIFLYTIYMYAQWRRRKVKQAANIEENRPCFAIYI